VDELFKLVERKHACKPCSLNRCLCKVLCKYRFQLGGSLSCVVNHIGWHCFILALHVGVHLCVYNVFDPFGAFLSIRIFKMRYLKNLFILTPKIKNSSRLEKEKKE